MVGIALGGLGVVSLRLPFTTWSSSAHVLDLPSVVLTICLVAFFTLIAYLTNPNEASFRAFLTELVFRQHLSRLSEAQNSIEADDLDDDSPSRQSTSDDEPHRIRKLSNHRLNATSTSSSSDTTAVPIVFHFANKASVSLRTPNYDFRSFLIVTFAVVPPVEMAMIPPNPPSSHTHHHSPSIPPKLISWNNPLTRGSCFIGAFGRWWLAFEMDMQPRQVKLAAQNDAAIASRLRQAEDDTNITMDSSLSVLSSRHEDFIMSGKTAAKLQQQPGAAIPRRSSGGSRANSKTGIPRERSSIQSFSKRDPVSFSANPHPPRPTTPPPLPKSASLPLHAKRIPPPSPEQQKQPRIVPTLPSSPPACPSAPLSAPAVPDQSPIIVDLTEQLEATRNATSDLKTQLSQAHATSTSATSILEEEVARARATKKNEDTARGALKARTKSLDDARRQADSAKREAEKRLKAAESQRDRATDLIGRLGAAVVDMKLGMEKEVVRVEEQRVSDADKRVTLTAEIANQREELKNVNAHVQILAARARVLESAIVEEKEKYEKLKEVRDKQVKEKEKQREKENEGSASSSSPVSSFWPPRLSSSEHPPGVIGPLASTFSGIPTLRPPQVLIPQILPHSHPPGNLNINTSQFRPFGPETASPVSSDMREPSLSPISTSLIPSSLMQSIDILSPHGQPMTEPEATSSPVDSPTSSGGGIGTIYEEEPFTLVEHKEAALSMPPIPSRIRFDDASIVSPSVFSGHNAASKLLQRPKSPLPSPLVVPSQNSTGQSRRRWFGGMGRERGLNPGAKEFTLSNQAFVPSISHQDNNSTKLNFTSSTSNLMTKPMDCETVGFGRTSSGHVHTDSHSKMRTMTSEFGATRSTTTTSSSPDFFHHPRSTLSAPSLQDTLFIHTNSTGQLSLKDSSSPPARSAGSVHVVSPPPVPSFPFENGFFSTLQNAFAPSPEEREVLLRALGGGTGSANTSREKLSAMINNGGSGTVSTTGPSSSSGSGSSSSSGSAHRTTNSISNPVSRGSGAIMHVPFKAHGHTRANTSVHPSHSQTQRSVFDPWAGEGKSGF